jgi:hypothetical protein
MPSYEDTWQGDRTLAQINWVRYLAGRAGVTIWDAQLTAISWRTAAVWSALKAFNGQGAQ